MSELLSPFLLWPVMAPLIVAAAVVASVAARRTSLRLVGIGAISLLLALALYGVIEGSSWQNAVVWSMAGLPILLATSLVALVGVVQTWKPLNAALVSILVGVLLMPVATFVHLLTTCFFADTCV